MTGKPLKTGLLSFGMSGKIFHAPFIADNPLFEFIAVVERSKKEADKHYPGIISYNSVQELLDNPAIELVIINTPNDTHFEFSKKALESGKHILVEKPFVPTSQEARELFDLGKSLNKKVMVYHNRRWNSDFLSVKNVIESNRIGKLIEMHIRFDRYKPEIGPKVFKEAPIPASGIAYDLGSHMIDQAIHLFGTPHKTLKIGTKNRKYTQIEDYVCFVLTYGEGLQVFITVSNLVVDNGPAYVLRGSEGTFKKLRSDVQEDQLIEGLKPSNPSFGVEPEESQGTLTYINSFEENVVSSIPAPTASIVGLFEEVYHAIRSDKPFPVTEEQVITQLEILEQPYWNQE